MTEQTLDTNGMILNARVDRVRVYKELADGNSCFVLTLTQDGRQYTLPPYSVDNIDRLRIGKIDPRFVALDEDGKATDTRVQAVLKEAISQEIRQGRCGVLLNRTGWVELPNGRYVYNTGMQVIGDTGGIEVKLSDTLPQLELTDQCIEMDDKQLLQSYLRKLSREPDILILLAAHMVRSLLASMFERLGFPLRYILYLVGVQGSGKTTAANDFGLPFTDVTQNTPAPATRALSSKSAVRDFAAEYRDMSALLDDVCTSSSAETRRVSTNIAAYTLRFAADRIYEAISRPGGGQRKVRCTSGLIITGEFPMSKPSDLTRCVIVEVDHQMRGKEADDRAVSCAVATRFLKHIAAHYDLVSAEISSALSDFHADAVEEGGPRQQQHLGEISCAFQLLLEYARAIGAIDDIEMAEWGVRLKSALGRSLSANMRLTAKFERENVSNVAKIMVDAMKSETILLAKNKDKFTKNPDKYAGFEGHKHTAVYIRLSSLQELLTSVSGKVWTDSATGKLLRENGLVEVGKDGHTAKAKFPQLGRFVPINKENLEKQAKI
ncbi:hypothetical protein [Agathobaculum sp.]|uniref:hypothetical protein n=1 Tax=Agathobaculum sp. TaxID=2048138 RepID=UPI003AEF8FD3